MSFLAEKCEIVSASRRRSARDCRGAIVERVLWAVLVRGLAVGAEVVVSLAAVTAVLTGRTGVGMATGMAGATGVTGAGAEKSSGEVTGAGAEKSNGAEIWIREVAGRDFGTEVAGVL